MTFGQRLRELRKRMGLTQIQTAARIGCNLINYRRWEKDEVSPRMEMMFQIAEYYKMSVSTLMKGVNEIPKHGTED